MPSISTVLWPRTLVDVHRSLAAAVEVFAVVCGCSRSLAAAVEVFAETLENKGRKVFDEMPMRNSVTWNAMITGYCSQSKKAKDCAFEVLFLFKDMLVDVCGVNPTHTTMVCVLSTSSQLGVLESGACVHGYIEKTIYMPENDLFVGTGLVDMYSKCGCLDSALSIF
ncbi:hypothetical protein LWI29_035823 [Acer saccharum]|uniref:Pentatricopeptide repeat-containing protein n=1 Tax=Acer saccharum TaxID=4024 RepID=A0AA39VH76_ACESA|nr:hypothetical protein LWI29_035823 [Acer saccharum]